LMLGPVIGGPLYDELGYFWSFVAFAVLLGMSMIIAMVITPGALNNSTEEE
jgi:predicted MFS family arabinose efflux permease